MKYMRADGSTWDPVDPSTWPMDPPTEPGFYWCGLQWMDSWATTIVEIHKRNGELRYTVIDGLGGFDRPLSGWASVEHTRWRPGKIEP